MIVSALVGLPQCGRTTLLKLLSNSESHEVATVKLFDERLEKIAKITNSSKVTHISIKILDPPGSLEKGGALFSKIQPVDCLIVTIRAFNTGFSIPTPQKDAQHIFETFLLFDFSSAETRKKTIESNLKKCHSPDERKELENELFSLNRFMDAIESGKPIREVISTSTDEQIAKNQGFLSAKKWLCIVNFEDVLDNNITSDIEKILHCPAVPIFAKLEREIQLLDEEDANVFRKEYGLPNENPLERFTNAIKNALDIVIFFTANEKEARAWTLLKGSNALVAAGKVHSDIARGFIRAEVIEWGKLVQCGSYNTAKANALLKSEGKNYIIQDGDVILFKFNV